MLRNSTLKRAIWRALENLNFDPLPIFGRNYSRMGQPLLEENRVFNKTSPPERPILRAGGGPTKRAQHRNSKHEERKDAAEPVVMCDWSDWLGKGTQGREKLDEQSNRLIGGAKAPEAIETYDRCFRRWAEFRKLQEENEFILPQEDKHDAERDVLRFITLHHGPLQKTAATVELYLRAMAYMHRLHTGINPINEMFRVKAFLQGARRDEGPPNRKLPVSCEDLLEIQRSITPGCLGERIIFCVILLGWYFMLRKSEYLGPGMKGNSPGTFRHSIRAMDLEAYCDSKRVAWGLDCDSVTLHIHGSKTDWLNCGTVRTHGALPEIILILSYALLETWLSCVDFFRGDSTQTPTNHLPA